MILVWFGFRSSLEGLRRDDEANFSTTTPAQTDEKTGVLLALRGVRAKKNMIQASIGVKMSPAMLICCPTGM